MQNRAFYEKNESYPEAKGFYGRAVSDDRSVGEALREGGFGKGCHAALLVVLVICAGLAMLFSQPHTALAKSYSMPEVTIDAIVEPDGNLRVSEQRTFDLDGEFAEMRWDYGNLPEGSALSVESVRMAHADGEGNLQEDWVKLSSAPFQLSWREDGGPGMQAYSFDEPMNTVYVFFDESDCRIVVELTYTIEDAVRAFSDVGELYWQFIGSEWEEGASNITLTVSLPMPDGAVVTGDDVRAWGHGPLDSTVAVEDDATVVYHVPQVERGTYAQARVLFPTKWLTGVSAQDDNAYPSTARLDTVLDEERTWSDHGNAERAVALGSVIAVVVGCLALLIWGLYSFMRYGKELKPTFADKYWRTAPVAGEHPAVIGRVYRFNEESPNDFTATIMHLANKGALLIDEESRKVDGLAVKDCRLTRVPEIELTLNSEIDRHAMTVLFDVIAEGQSSLWSSAIRSFAQSNPQRFHNAMASWQGRVSAHTAAGEYFESCSKAKRMRMRMVAAAVIAICAFLAFGFSNPFVIIPGIITGIAFAVMPRFMERRTQKGVDAYARCVAMKRWLVDSPVLDECASSDVKAWDEPMVYAMVFGISPDQRPYLGYSEPLW